MSYIRLVSYDYMTEGMFHGLRASVIQQILNVRER